MIFSSKTFKPNDTFIKKNRHRNKSFICFAVPHCFTTNKYKRGRTIVFRRLSPSFHVTYTEIQRFYRHKIFFGKKIIKNIV